MQQHLVGADEVVAPLGAVGAERLLHELGEPADGLPEETHVEDLPRRAEGERAATCAGDKVFLLPSTGQRAKSASCLLYLPSFQQIKNASW